MAKLERSEDIRVEIVQVSVPHAVERLRHALEIILAAAGSRGVQAPNQNTPATGNGPSDNKSNPSAC